ncbi:MAG: histidinol dehydrogenase [Polyangiaceae bacterium]
MTPPTTMLRTVAPDDIAPARHAVDPATLVAAATIVQSVADEGDAALRHHAERLDALPKGAPLLLDRHALDAARDALPSDQRALLERAADRIRRFAEAQRAALTQITVPVPGGQAGHTISPVQAAGCYAPGGRYPLPSSVLMTAVTARAAGVQRVIVASPKPAPITLAAASIAGADALLQVGGAQAIAALAHGTASIPHVDVIVGPGNKWVTAAKQLVVGTVGIDMLAGPSELVVLADESADPDLIAADLLAQAEHDPEAVPLLVTTSAPLVEAVEQALQAQLQTLPTAETASAALQANGQAVLCPHLEAALDVCDRLAPEHLELMTASPETLAPRLGHYGALFIGPGAAEVLGDYATGPNHVLPTGGTARYTGGLSALTFLRVRTWLQITTPTKATPLAKDAAALADLEGHAAHAATARRRT